MPQRNLNGQIEVPYSFFFPIYGYCKYWLIHEIKERNWLIITENVILYLGIGLALGLLNLHFPSVWEGLKFVGELAVIFIFESLLYYFGIIQSVFKKSVTQESNGNIKGNAVIGYLYTQGAVLWFTVLGWGLVDVIKVVILWIR